MKMRFLLFLSTTLLFLGCKDDVVPALEVPRSYTSINYDANAAQEISLRKQLSDLSNYMKKAEKIENTLQIDSLQYFFSDNGLPSLRSVTGTYYENLITSNWFPTMVDCSGNAFDPINGATATNGGVFGARLLDKRAKENLQEIEKGLYGAAFFKHLIDISKDDITEDAVDKMVSIYGAHPNFPNTNTTTNTSTPDVFLALYAARRDKNDGTGLYTQIRDKFIRLKAAAKGGKDYNADKATAMLELKSLIEKAMMATVINYGYSSITKLSTTNPPATTISAGLHDLAEMVGFVHGFKAIPSTDRTIKDSDIDEILANLLAPVNNEASMYLFVTNGANMLGNITAVQEKIKAIYGFTNAEMEDFKQNWITVQGR